jgi:hypothetical protein
MKAAPYYSLIGVVGMTMIVIAAFMLMGSAS